MVSTEEIKNKLKEVIDPEIGYDIISLGEIEDIKIENNKVKIVFLPTTPLCPFIPMILSGIEEKIRELNLEADIEIDFKNIWSLDRVDPEIRRKLGL